MNAISLPGINIQAPWAKAILTGRKTIETRCYPMPKQWEGQLLVIIETPGKKGGFSSRVAGFVIFGKSYRYDSRLSFMREQKAHLVEPEDPVFGWSEGSKPKWGWPVVKIYRYTQTLPLGFRRGIRYSKAVPITKPPLRWLESLAGLGSRTKPFRAPR